MKKRLVGGAIFVAFVATFMWLRNISLLYFDLFVLFLIMLGSFEVMRGMRDYLTKANYTATALYVIFLLPCYYLFGGLSAVFYLFVTYFWASAVISIYSRGYAAQNLAAASLVGVYPVLIFSFLIEMNHWANFGLAALLLIFFVGPMCDVGAYLVGSSVGGKKLCPSISPHKTVSGAVGGIIGGMIGSVIVYLASVYLFDLDMGKNASIWFFLAFGVIASVLTEFGDLVESALKRSLNLKDFGNVLPGHGGIMDRFDGVLFVIFATYIYFSVFLVYLG